jgi:8-oxo-dGTP diphosphatase
LEETGLNVKGRDIVAVTNDVFTDLGKHYITMFVVCEMVDPKEQPQVSIVTWPGSSNPCPVGE